MSSRIDTWMVEGDVEMECEQCKNEIQQEYPLNAGDGTYKFCSKRCRRIWKKKHNRTPHKSRAMGVGRQSVIPKTIWFYLTLALLVSLIASIYIFPNSRALDSLTMPPEKFSGRVREAYQVANDMPGVLREIPCFCKCERYGHKNLMDCHRNEHAANCGICIEEDLMAARLYKSGKGVKEIREEIIQKFSNM